jgi:hypothetical protein
MPRKMSGFGKKNHKVFFENQNIRGLFGFRMIVVITILGDPVRRTK